VFASLFGSIAVVIIGWFTWCLHKRAIAPTLYVKAKLMKEHNGMLVSALWKIRNRQGDELPTGESKIFIVCANGGSVPVSIEGVRIRLAGSHQPIFPPCPHSVIAVGDCVNWPVLDPKFLAKHQLQSIDVYGALGSWKIKNMRQLLMELAIFSGVPHRIGAFAWLERTWAATDPTLDIVPAPNDPHLPTDEQLKADGFDDALIAVLRKNPRGFPHTLRRFGFDFGRVRGEGFAARAVGAVHFVWKKL